MRDIYDILSDIFNVFEQMRTLFRHWNKEGPDAFMEAMLKFRALEHELVQNLGDEEAHILIRGIYRSIFPQETKTP